MKKPNVEMCGGSGGKKITKRKKEEEYGKIIKYKEIKREYKRK